MSQSINLYKQLANHKLFNKTINFNLKRIKLVLRKLNHPEKKLSNVINFLGSSGKYSTLYSLKCFIESNNQKTSAYISPSLKDIKERFWMSDRYLTHHKNRYLPLATERYCSEQEYLLQYHDQRLCRKYHHHLQIDYFLK